MIGVDDLSGFSVEPKTNCPHIADNFNPECFEAPDAIDFSRPCQECKNTKENWLCLKCGREYCSRYVNSHGLSHFESCGHCILLSFLDLSFWCYLCDEYIMSPVIYPIYEKAHIIKFNTRPGEEVVSTSLTSIDVEKAVLSAVQSKGKEVARSTEDEHGSLADVSGLDNSLISTNRTLDCILGVIYGNALGDAVGLATEFLSKKEVQELYPSGPIPFPGYIRNFHNMRWTAGDWTDDTDQMVCILDTLVETKRADPLVLARKIKQWARKGFPECGDSGGLGLGTTTAKVLSREGYLLDPKESARAVWESSRRQAAPNGAVMRTSVLGCFQYYNLDSVEANTVEMCKITHFDPRCVASCVASTAAIALIVSGNDPNNTETLGHIIDVAVERGLAHLKDTDYEEEFVAHIKRSSSEEALHSLRLDEPKKIGYTLKCVGSGFWALCSDRDFEKTMDLLIKEGGDADTNGAIAGALAGARLGYSKLPRHWLAAMPHKRWLDSKVVEFLQLVGIPITKEEVTYPRDKNNTATL